MSMKFEWNPRKATANKAKHGVSFDEALTVFSDKLAKVFDDEGHSDDENREIIIGHSAKQRLLIVSFVERSDSVVSSVRARQPSMSSRIMKKTSRSGVRKSSSTPKLLREYRFDYRKAKPNRFANRMAADAVAVVLDPDVAMVFSSPESVNTLLRSVMSAMPKESSRTTK